jgi:hypothetical protein
MRYHRLSPLLVVLLGGCSANLEVPADAHVACKANGDCPAGYRCLEAAARCVPTSAEGEGPSLSSSTVLPARLGLGQRLTAALVADRVLLLPPHVELRAGGTSYAMKLRSGSGAGPWEYEYETSGAESEGSASVVSDLQDEQGLVRSDVELGSLTLDFTPPEVGALVVAEAVAGSWVDSTTITVMPVLAPSSEVPTSIDVTGNLAAASELQYAASFSLALSAGDGDKALSFTFADDVGNSVSVPLHLSLETTTPSSPVVIDEPPGSEVWVNQDSLTLIFHLAGNVPADADGFVISYDGGVTWAATTHGTLHTIAALAQNADTTVRLAERDVFGNRTPTDLQGVLTIHEASAAPAPVVPWTSMVVGNLGSEVGLLVQSTDDFATGLLTLEVTGGSFADYQDAGVPPFVRLPAAPPGEAVAYAFRTRDRAGNASPVSAVIVADDPTTEYVTLATSTAPPKCVDELHCQRPIWVAAGDRVLYSEVDGPDLSSATFRVGACTRQAFETFACGRQAIPCPPAGVSASYCTNTRYRIQGLAPVSLGAVFVDITATFPSDSAVRHVFFGADGQPGTADANEGVTATLALNATSLGAFGTRVVYSAYRAGAWSMQFQDLGADGRPNTSDGTEVGETAIGLAGANGSDSATAEHMDFDGRYFVWATAPASVWLYDLGPDGKPNAITSPDDDAGPVQIPNATSGLVRLFEGRLFVRNADTKVTTMTLFGADGRYGTADDVATTLGELTVEGVHGDKAVISVAGKRDLLDLSSGAVLSGRNPLLTSGYSLSFGLGDGFFAGGFQKPGAPPGSAELGFYRFLGDPLVYRFADGAAVGPPGGAGSAALVFAANPKALLDLRGEVLAIDLGLFGRGADVDIDGGCATWIDSGSQVMLYCLGPDGRAGTADDRGPVAVTSSGVHRWPALSGRRLVWADLTSQPGNHEWDNGSAIVSTLHGIDLGADGFLGGGDDTPLDFSSVGGNRAVWPDISGTEIVYLDYSTDTDNACPARSGETDCQPSVRRFAIGDTSSTLVAGGKVGRGWPLIEGRTIVWTEHNGADWDIKVHTIGGGTATVGVAGVDEIAPSVSGTMLAYWADTGSTTVQGPAVIAAGADGSWATSDDVVLREACDLSVDVCPEAVDLLAVIHGPRQRWLLPNGYLLLDAGFLPAVPPVDRATRDQVNLAIPGIGSVSDQVTLGADAAAHIEHLGLRVTVNHPVHTQLRFQLVSPSGDAATIACPAGTGLLEHRFSLKNAPSMLNFWGEPVAGVWTLTAIDVRTATQAGTLVSWSLVHQR